MKNVRLKGMIIPAFFSVVSIILTSCFDNGETTNIELETLDKQIKEFESYFSENGLNANSLADGVYQVINEEGTGELVKATDIVEVQYEIKKFDTEEVFLSDSSYIYKPGNGFYSPDMTGNLNTFNSSVLSMKEFESSDFYIASYHLFGTASGEINDVVIAANQTTVASIKVVDVRTVEEQKAYELDLLDSVSTKEGYDITPSETGLFKVVLAEGDGTETIESTSEITISYKGSLLDGKVFDEGENVTFPLANLIEGWKEGMVGLKKGASIILYIPSHLAYGENGVISNGKPSIPSFAPLKFEIDISDFQ